MSNKIINGLPSTNHRPVCNYKQEMEIITYFNGMADDNKPYILAIALHSQPIVMDYYLENHILQLQYVHCIPYMVLNKKKN